MVKRFKAGCTAEYQKQWENVTSDPEVLHTVSGRSIEFQDTTHVPVRPNNLSKEEKGLVQKEIDKLLVKGIIKKSQHEEGEISPIFLTTKPDGTHRLILNLKKVNEHIDNMHFKMETMSTILKLIRPNCYVASVDIKDACYSVPIAE